MLYSYFIITTKSVSFGVGNITVNLFLFFLLFLIIFNAKEIIDKNKLTTVLFLVDIMLLFLSNLSNNSGFGSIASVITFLLILQISSYIKINKKTMLLLLIIDLLFWMYSLTIDYEFYNINTNNAASSVFYLCVIIINLMWIIINNKFYRKIGILFIIIITLLNIIKYDCRNIMLVLSLLLLLVLFDLTKFFKKSNTLKRNLFWFIITIGSLIMTIIYIFLYKNNYYLNLSFISTKSFYSGRESIWLNLYDIFKKHIVFGIGSKSIYFPRQGAHNYMLSVLTLFGLPHFIVFISNIYSYVSNLFSNKINNKNYLCLMSIMCLFFTEFFEASFIDGSKLYTLFILSVLFFSVIIKERDDEYE